MFLRENLASWVGEVLNSSREPVWMSAMNYAETLIITADRRLGSVNEIRKMIDDSRIQIIACSARQAEIAAAARLRFPLNLGDCFAYALAKDGQRALLTLDSDFRNCDIKLILPRL